MFLITWFSVSGLTLKQICRESNSWIIIVLPTHLNALPIYIIKTFVVTSCPCFQVGSRFIRSLGRAIHPLSRGEGSFLNFVRTQDNRGDNTLVGPLRNLACCQAEHAVGVFLILVFLARLMQPGGYISRTSLLFMDQSGLTAQHPPCLTSTSQSRPILGITWFWDWIWKTRSPSLLWNIEFEV